MVHRFATDCGVAAAAPTIQTVEAGLMSQLGVRAETRIVRIHLTTIINIDRTKDLRPWFSGDAIVIRR